MAMLIRLVWTVLALMFIAPLVLAVMLSVAMSEELLPPTAEEAEDIKRWIPAACCRTHNCCRKVHESALILLPHNRVQVRTTGQVVGLTGWSQDRNTWRCTCDFEGGEWIVRPEARTWCVFPHHSGY